MTWQAISPDLTLNDPAHHKQDESGGLTLDATQAENHNTILAIAPSTLKQGVIWVGTDDGNVQLTQDGGKTWANLTSRIPGLPKEAWIPQVTASRHNPGEAFVVANAYRMGLDLTPYIYRTTDFGKTWTRIIDEKKAKGYALCFLQDPVEPKLMFAGTEHGLWVSIDEARTWTRWSQGMPAVPTMDLAIQEREADLVIGTFGRSIYVLDNIRPLRKLAATGLKPLDQPLAAFEPSGAYQVSYRGPQGYGKDAEGIYQAANRPAGVMLTYYIKPVSKTSTAPVMAAKGKAGKKNLKANAADANLSDEGLTVSLDTASTEAKMSKKPDSVVVSIYDEAGRLIRTLKQAPDTALGVQRITWDLTETAVPMPSTPGMRRFGGEPTGNPVIPGKYKMVVSYAGHQDSTSILVQPDPRVPFNKEEAIARRALQERLNQHIRQLTAATNRVQEASKATDLLLTQLKDQKGPEIENLRKSTKMVQDSLKTVQTMLVGKRSDKQGIGRPYMLTPLLKVQETASYLSRRTGMPTETETQLLEQAETITRSTISKVDSFFSTQWAEYYKQVKATPLSIIKEYSDVGQAGSGR